MHILFSVVENKKFQAWVQVTTSVASTLLPRDRDTIRNWIIQEFKTRQRDLVTTLQVSKSLVHFSFDLWTSPNYRSILGVVGHYLNKKGENVTTLLGLCHLMGAHSGANMAEQVVQIIKDYNLIDKIGYFVLDNATNNDTCLEETFDALSLEVQVKTRRLRCLGHVINLTAQAFLYGENAEAFISEVGSDTVLANEAEELKIWRKKGPIGKLHNIVTFIRRTPQRREAFQKIIIHDTELVQHYNQLQVLANNETRCEGRR